MPRVAFLGQFRRVNELLWGCMTENRGVVTSKQPKNVQLKAGYPLFVRLLDEVTDSRGQSEAK